MFTPRLEAFSGQRLEKSMIAGELNLREVRMSDIRFKAVITRLAMLRPSKFWRWAKGSDFPKYRTEDI